jgi:hypothetical protein
MNPHDTSPDDPQPGLFERAGVEVQADWDIATGKRGALWRGGRFRRNGGGCSTLVALVGRCRRSGDHRCSAALDSSRHRRIRVGPTAFRNDDPASLARRVHRFNSSRNKRELI